MEDSFKKVDFFFPPFTPDKILSKYSEKRFLKLILLLVNSQKY